jgi:hypothetical protein
MASKYLVFVMVLLYLVVVGTVIYRSFGVFYEIIFMIASCLVFLLVRKQARLTSKP